MARITKQEKLQNEIHHIEDVLESLESPAMDHIKNIYFNAKGEHFLHSNKYRGKIYVSLALQRVDTDGGDAFPEPHEIAAVNDNLLPTAKYVAPPEGKLNDLEITETLTKKQAILRFEKKLSEKTKELENFTLRSETVLVSEIGTGNKKKLSAVK